MGIIIEFEIWDMVYHYWICMLDMVIITWNVASEAWIMNENLNGRHQFSYDDYRFQHAQSVMIAIPHMMITDIHMMNYRF